MATATVCHDVEVEEMSTADSRDMFDRLVRDRLHISGAEFLRRLDAGEYDGVDDDDIVRLSLSAPYGR